MFCPMCGKQLEDGTTWCMDCGHSWQNVSYPRLAAKQRRSVIRFSRQFTLTLALGLAFGIAAVLLIVLLASTRPQRIASSIPTLTPPSRVASAKSAPLRSSTATIPSAAQKPRPSPTLAHIRPPAGILKTSDTPGEPGSLIIENGTGSDGLAILTAGNNPLKTVQSGIVYASGTLTMTAIADGTYWLYFSTGEEWDPSEEEFTQSVSRQRFNDKLNYETTATQYEVWKVTLHRVAGGTATTSEVPVDKFPKAR